MNRDQVLLSSTTGITSETSVVHSPFASTVLSPRQLAALAAATDRIIPPDNEGPGGAAGGSLAYIVRHLEDGGNLVPFRSEYQSFLDALAADDFTSLDTAAQDALLSRIEQSGTVAAGRFFRRFAEHAQEGYYTNPENWPSLGFRVTG
jgi:hypothetical protein